MLDLKHPEVLTSIKLRKQLASYSQLLNLTEDEVDSMATFKGHSINIHRNFYWLPVDVVELAKFSRIFKKRTGLKLQNEGKKG